jgi:hypothetical protein
MKSFCLACWLAALAAAAPLHVEQSAFHAGADGVPPGWKTWAARPEIAPRTLVDSIHYRKRPGALAISGNSNAAEYGGWEYPVANVEPRQWYRFVAYYRAEGLQYEPLQVVARLDWMTAQGRRAGEPDYAYAVTPEGEWRRVTLDAPAPEAAAAVKLQLFLQNAPYATLWWDDISFD